MKVSRTRKTKTRRKPSVKRTSAWKDRRGARLKTFFVRSWWVLRGVAAGTAMLGLVYTAYIGTGKVVAHPALSIKTIQVEGCRLIDSESIIRISGLKVGQPLLRIDLKEVRDRVVRHPVVKDATVVRELPDTLRITVLERTPAAAVMGREFAVVDRDGVVLYHPPAYTDKYPVITGITSVPGVGKVVMDALPALEAMEKLATAGFLGADSISELNTSGKRLLVSMTGSGTLLVLPRGGVQDALLRLARITEAGLFDTGTPGYDLRFQGRVVVMPERIVSGEELRGSSLAGG
jgi:cell division septal protein FtsQ